MPVLRWCDELDVQNRTEGGVHPLPVMDDLPDHHSLRRAVTEKPILARIGLATAPHGERWRNMRRSEGRERRRRSDKMPDPSRGCSSNSSAADHEAMKKIIKLVLCDPKKSSSSRPSKSGSSSKKRDDGKLTKEIMKVLLCQPESEKSRGKSRRSRGSKGRNDDGAMLKSVIKLLMCSEAESCGGSVAGSARLGGSRMGDGSMLKQIIELLVCSSSSSDDRSSACGSSTDESGRLLKGVVKLLVCQSDSSGSKGSGSKRRPPRSSVQGKVIEIVKLLFELFDGGSQGRGNSRRNSGSGSRRKSGSGSRRYSQRKYSRSDNASSAGRTEETSAPELPDISEPDE